MKNQLPILLLLVGAGALAWWLANRDKKSALANARAAGWRASQDYSAALGLDFRSDNPGTLLAAERDDVLNIGPG